MKRFGDIMKPVTPLVREYMLKLAVAVTADASKKPLMDLVTELWSK